MGFTPVVVEEHAWGPVQLRDDDAFGAVYHKGSILRHERDFAHVHFLLFDVFDRFVGRLFVIDDQAHLDAKWRGIGDASQHALFDVERRLSQPVVHVLERGTS